MYLNSVNGIGPITLNRLLERFQSDPWKVLSASAKDLATVRGVGDQLIQTLQANNATEWLKKEKEKLSKMGGHFWGREHFPSFLNELPDPPIGLYTLGEIPSTPFVSIVGTRIPSLYGKKLARKLAFELAQAGICIVSGMARGIDTEAHLGALDAGGKTLAFLGSGLDVIYPPENLHLYQRIKEAGAVLSEFPLGKRADRRTFPMRNRLVAGCSSAVLVIESAKTGGSMITARFAAEQGRTVFALPGRVDQPESQGCLDLIRDGAILIRNSTDILEEIAPMLPLPSKPMESDTHATQNCLNDLDNLEKGVLNLLKGGDRMSLDDIKDAINASSSQLASAITMLEIRGLLSKRADGKFEVNL
ncbi:MAG: DNA-processing protein DprA [Opitutales bacterium]